jgi:hypothetical protein
VPEKRTRSRRRSTRGAVDRFDQRWRA